MQTVVIVPAVINIASLARRSHYRRGPPFGTSLVAIRTPA
jgi:hypothetical protein